MMMDNWSRVITSQAEAKKKKKKRNNNDLLLAISSISLMIGLSIGIAAKSIPELSSLVTSDSNVQVWILNTDNSAWYDPSYSTTMDSELQFLMPWQLHPYGKLYHERDLMGRNS